MIVYKKLLPLIILSIFSFYSYSFEIQLNKPKIYEYHENYHSGMYFQDGILNYEGETYLFSIEHGFIREDNNTYIYIDIKNIQGPFAFIRPKKRPLMKSDLPSIKKMIDPIAEGRCTNLGGEIKRLGETRIEGPDTDNPYDKYIMNAYICEK